MIMILERLLDRLIRYRVIVLVLTLVITIYMGYLAINVDIRADTMSLLPNLEEEMEYLKDNGIPQNEYLVIGVERTNLFELSFLNTLGESIEQMKSMDHVVSIMSPFTQTAFQKSGSFFTLVTNAEQGIPPQNQTQLEIFKTNVTQGSFSKGILINEEEDMFLLLVEYKDITDFTLFMDKVEVILAPLREAGQVYISGNPPFEISAKKYLAKDISIFLSLGLLLILVVYYFGFKSKRSIILPVLVIIIGTIWTVGFMSLFNFPISLVSIVVPPLVLTLGSSYSIHILNSYFRYAPQGEVNDIKGALWISGAVSSVSSTIILASLTTVVGFLSLLVTSLSQLREFAFSSSFGILSCSILSMTVLPCAISFMKHPKEHQTQGIHHGIITRVIKATSHRIIKFRYFFVAIFLIIPVVFFITYPLIQVNTDYATYFPEDDIVITDMDHLITEMEGFSELTILFRHEDQNKFLDLATLEQLNTLEKKLLMLEDISHTRSFNSFVREAQLATVGTNDFPTKRSPILFLSRALNQYRLDDEKSEETINSFVNKDYSRYNIHFKYYDYSAGKAMGENNMPSFLSEINRVVSENLPSGLEYELLGPRLFYGDLYTQLTKDLSKSTLTAFILIFFVAAYTFRSFSYGFLTLIPMMAGVFLNFIIMVLLKIPLDLTTIMVACVSIGIGVDDSIHFLLHYKQSGDIYHTMELTGRPIVLTSFSIMAGLILLMFSTFRPIGYFGLLISIALLNTTVGCLLFLPCFLSLRESWKARKK